MSFPHHHRPDHPHSRDPITGAQSIVNVNIDVSLQAAGDAGDTVAGGRGRHVFILEADGIRDWALVSRDRKPDRVLSIGAEDRIGILRARSVDIGGRRGRITIRDHRDRLVCLIRDPDITLAQAQQMVFPLPQGWQF